MVALVIGGPFGLGPIELLLILAVVVLIFGAGKLADVGGALGKSIKEFRKASSDDQPKNTAQLSSPAAPVINATATEVRSAVCANPACRAELPENAQFCLKCGTRVGAPAAPAT